jgi:pantetheine-phosphate adenylyltransferase
MRTVVYPGTFNPITIGHIDLIKRARKLFDRVIVAIGTSPQKNPETHLSDRIALCREVLADVDGVEVDGFNELLVEYVRRKDARFILRGIRTVADFEYEFQMVDMNRRLAPEIEYVFLAPSENCSFISSTLVREISMYGGDISRFVHPAVVRALAKE